MSESELHWYLERSGLIVGKIQVRSLELKMKTMFWTTWQTARFCTIVGVVTSRQNRSRHRTDADLADAPILAGRFLFPHDRT